MRCLRRFLQLGHIIDRLAEMDVGIDFRDPRHRHEMVLAIRRAGLGQLDVVVAFEVIDLTDFLAGGIEHIHMFLDFRNVCHVVLPY